jgi:Pyridoxamine 5'-phosphate oxidase
MCEVAKSPTDDQQAAMAALGGSPNRTSPFVVLRHRRLIRGCTFLLVERTELGPVLDQGVVEFIQGGVAVGVATRDDDLRPEFARGWGPEVSADGRSLRLCVTAPEGSQMRANLEQNGAVAVGFSPPTIARAVQVKGVAGPVSEPETADLERVERHLRSFVAEAERIGAPAELSERMFERKGLVAVQFSIEEVFDQTPGPTAGRRL